MLWDFNIRKKHQRGDNFLNLFYKGLRLLKNLIMLYSKDKVSFAIFQKIAAKKTVKTLVRSVCPKMAQQGSDFLLCWERGYSGYFFFTFLGKSAHQWLQSVVCRLYLTTFGGFNTSKKHSPPFTACCFNWNLYFSTKFF